MPNHSATSPTNKAASWTASCGADDRVRTGDLNLGKVALYQLSYSRISLRVSTAVAAGTGEVFGLMSGVP